MIFPASLANLLFVSCANCSVFDTEASLGRIRWLSLGFNFKLSDGLLNSIHNKLDKAEAKDIFYICIALGGR